MARFLTPLSMMLIDEIDNANMAGGEGVRTSWRLLNTLRFESDILGRVYEVPAGFDTDLASVPRTPATAMFIGLANKAAVLHDHAYRTHDLSKDDADAMFLEAMTVDRIPHRDLFYAAVRAFGQNSYDPNAQPDEDIEP